MTYEELLEELQNKEAVSKFSSPLSGKNLPFSSLSDKLKKNKYEAKTKICFVLTWYCDEIAYMYNVCVKMFRTPRIEGV